MSLSDFVKQQAKNMLKNLVFKFLKSHILKIIIAIIIVVVLLVSLWYMVIGNKTIGTVGDIARGDEENENIVIDEDDRKYEIDEEIAKRIKEALDRMFINKETLGLTDELIMKFYEAEIITSFPDLRERDKIGTSIPDGEIQGRIQFKRKYSDETEELLEYMNFEDFRKKLAYFGYDLQDAEGNSIKVDKEDIYSSKEDVEKNYNQIKRYFTLDKENNLIIATMNSEERIVTYSDYAKEEGNKDEYHYNYYIDVQKVNYQIVIEKYAMPIEFFVSMLLVSENKGFCEEIVELVKDTSIIIEIQDNLTTMTTTEDYDYKSEFNFSKEIKYDIDVTTESGGTDGDDNSGGSSNETTDGNTTDDSEGETTTETKHEKIELKGSYIKEKNLDSPYKKDKTINKLNQVELQVTYANIWIAEYKSVYECLKEDTTTVESFPIEGVVEYDRGKEQDYHKLLDRLVENIPSGAYNIEKKYTLKEKQSERETRVTTNVISNKYTKSSSEVLEQEEKFLSLLKIDPTTKEFDKTDRNKNTKVLKYKDTYGRTTSPSDNILLASEILFDYLARYEKTQSFEEVMRYLLYVYTGKSYGVTELDFSIYEPNDFTPIGGGTSGLSGIQGQIYDYLLSKGMSGIGSAAILGNIERESSFNVSAINESNPHYGLCQWGGERFEKLKAEAKKVGKTWEDLNVQLDFLWLELNTSYSSTKEELMNATDLYYAVEYFTKNYEVCGNYDVEVDIRYKYAKKWYDLAAKNNHSGVDDIRKYNLNVHKGFIEYKQLDYTTIPPSYQATSSPAGTIKDKGCMPTSISIILSGMGVKDAWGNAYTPESLISTGTMAHIKGGSSTAGNAKNTFTKCGLSASGVKYTTNKTQAKKDILQNLNAGNVLMVHASTGYYTSGGHLMTIIDVQGEQVYLSNPGSRNKTGWISLNTLLSRNVDWYMVVSR